MSPTEAPLERKEAIKRLSSLTRLIAKRGIASREDWRDWVEDDEDGRDRLPDFLDYNQIGNKGAPTAGQLIVPHFHPRLPLIGWNYTKLAHNLLEFYPQIWTDVIRQCRGIVFDHTGKLIALPFEKFFNYSTGEHPETANLPTGKFWATEKHDGDLGIVFRYKGSVRVTTRGTFGYKSAELAEEMIDELDRRAWRKYMPEHYTLLVEIIHPETRKLRLYRKSSLVLIGAFDNETLWDFEHDDLKVLAINLGLEHAHAIQFDSPSELQQMMLEPTKNREGYVGRFANGKRAKFKYINHLGRMYASAMEGAPCAYVLKMLISGRWDEKITAMDDEPAHKAIEIRNAALGIVRKHKDYETRMEQLMRLPPKNQRTATYRELCRKFIADYI